mgnify:CR=1 FL=1
MGGVRMKRFLSLFLGMFFVCSILVPSMAFSEEKKETTSNATNQETPKQEKKKEKKEVGC